MSTFHDLFKVGDVITIDNADRPPWTMGRWRVVAVHDNAARVEPIIDGPADRRDPQAVVWIENGGITEGRRAD